MGEAKKACQIFYGLVFSINMKPKICINFTAARLMPCLSETKIPLSGYIRQIQGLQNLDERKKYDYKVTGI
ncbi:MAG: hypothetical protein SRB2_03248 [Desulfobacteraceae bacterium Eth-SRB2]|nr:MAG: hypothetical protein SRB2_03248 [Desulfobacteraceae bacterium Eth-SRB2]